MTYRLRQRPELLHWLRSLGGGGGGGTGAAAGAGLRGAVASLGIGVASAQAPPSGTEPRYALTSRLLVELAHEVRGSGARLLLLIRESELARMDARAIAAAGAVPRSISLDGQRQGGQLVRFVNDGHYNALGHTLAAEALTPVLLELLAGDGR